MCSAVSGPPCPAPEKISEVHTGQKMLDGTIVYTEYHSIRVFIDGDGEPIFNWPCRRLVLKDADFDTQLRFH